MPMPPEIAQASTQFMELLGALKARANLQTHNQCYAMLRAVLHEYRGYMTVPQADAGGRVRAAPKSGAKPRGKPHANRRR